MPVESSEYPYFGMTAEIYGTRKMFRCESGIFKKFHSTFDVFCRDHQVNILGDHGFLGLMVDRNATHRTPLDVCSFEAVNKAHDIVSATRRLPIVELFRRHIGAIHSVIINCAQKPTVIWLAHGKSQDI